jgi:hypothetical protein
VHAYPPVSITRSSPGSPPAPEPIGRHMDDASFTGAGAAAFDALRGPLRDVVGTD